MTLCWLNLKVLGFNCIEHDYLSSCFTGISQSESLDGQLSDPLPVNIGVHQGSILGLLLFLQYLNYLPTVTESCNINVFADDIEIGYTAKQGCSTQYTGILMLTHLVLMYINGSLY